MISFSGSLAVLRNPWATPGGTRIASPAMTGTSFPVYPHRPLTLEEIVDLLKSVVALVGMVPFANTRP